MHEIETKVLEVERDEIEKKLNALGAKKISEERLTVDWYGPKGLTHDGDDPWFLRVRTYGATGKHEVTWKAKSDILGTARKHKEINFTVSDFSQAGDLFDELDLEKYGHQEKERVSWKLQNVQFDLDIYPNMLPFLEIEAGSEEEINEIIQKLDLKNNQTWNDGERTLIKEKYNLDWFNMRF